MREDKWLNRVFESIDKNEKKSKDWRQKTNQSYTLDTSKTISPSSRHYTSHLSKKKLA